MSWTKLELITQAYSELGLASYNFDLEPEDRQSALQAMDAMMASWYSKNIRLGYPLPSEQKGSSVNDDSGVSDAAHEAIYTNLAMRIAPGIGKTPSPDTRKAARTSYRALLSAFAERPEMQIDNRSVPRGAGGKHINRRNPFLPYPDNQEMPVGSPTLEFE